MWHHWNFALIFFILYWRKSIQTTCFFKHLAFWKMFECGLSVSCSMFIHASYKVSLCFTVVLLTTTTACNSSLFMRCFIFYITVNQKFLSAINISEFHINLIQLRIFFKQCFTNCSPSVPLYCKRKTISVIFYLLHHS